MVSIGKTKLTQSLKTVLMLERCCEPDGVLPCPNVTHIATSLSNGYMMLGKDCKKSRFNPMTKHGVDETNMKTPFSEKIIVDEQLCFVTNKIEILNADVIIQQCVQNYDDAVIGQSRLGSFKLKLEGQ